MSNTDDYTQGDGGPQESSKPALPQRRAVGRPGQTTSRVGRDHIILKTQQFMREKPFYDFQRKEIAEYIQVTPALISYYFVEKLDLVLEASGPLVSPHSFDVIEIIHRDAPVLDRAKALIKNFIELGLRSGFAIDYFLSAIQRRNRTDEISHMAKQYTQIGNFMEELLSVSGRRIFSAAFLQSSIWGQCMYLSRQPHLRSIGNEREIQEAIEGLSQNVFDLLVNGLYPRTDLDK